MNKFKFFLTLMLIGMVNISSVHASSIITSEETPGRVLFISSYHAGFDTLPSQIEGIKSVFDDNSITLDIDYMDTKVHNYDENYRNYYQFLKTRLENGVPYDVVIVGDDNALQFIMDNRNQLFPSTPIVFFCINDMSRAKAANAMNDMTGIVEGISLSTNIELSLTLFPNTKKLTAIVDNTNTGIGDANAFMAMAENHPNLSFTLLNSSHYTYDELATQLGQLEENTVLFYLSMFEDKTGRHMAINEAARYIALHTKVPTIRMSIGGVGDGLLGGNMVSYEEQGRLAATMALNILRGADPDAIEMIKESPNKYYFDYNIMQKFNLSLSDVPEGSIILNPPSNFFKENAHILIPVLLIISVLALFIALLVKDNRRLKDKDLELTEKNIELTAIYEEMAATEEELRCQYDQMILSQQQLNESEERYRRLAYTDILTNLNNRLALMTFLDTSTKDLTHPWYLIYMDLDNFKDINDTHGHEVGDIILSEIGNRLRSFQNQLLYISRLGGDEFVAIVSNCHMDINAFIYELEAKIQEPISVEAYEFYVSCSIGISTFPKDGQDKNVLLRKADLAMYQSKADGKSMYQFYDDLMDEATHQRLKILNRLRHALDNNEFELYLQPQQDLANHKMTGVEFLIRLRDQEGEFISPEEFIPIAEELGIIKAIGTWVYESAARMMREWYQLSGEALSYSVNTSAIELLNPHFADNFLAILDDHNINRETVAIEITESCLISSKDSVLEQIHRLKEAGIEVHLDDFGTGYSSLNYLQSLPIDVLKIDRQFILDMTTKNQNRDMTQFIIDIAHRLNLIVIAEGVETEKQRELLKALGCDKIQGYLYSKPLPYADFQVFYHRNR